ncbi:hypothetical protein CASFOL_010188 [Castilleja foliolosa]|uniref:F-box domain-containing protein n=1 Tax=Castilleja foliolosa TaxID=1961234 RepID=A0ABD3DRV3_9LAMI
MGEIQFAEPIIHRLQSFLTGKEAARSTIVSKSWHSAWLTRPNLDLDDTYFRVWEYRIDHSSVDKFRKYAKKTIKRYEQSSLQIGSFNLCMEMNQYGRTALAKKLIVKALKIGATRLCVQLKRCDSFVLPNEVFGADNLVELSVSGCTIKLDDGVVIKCRRLESLSIDDNVYITNLSLFPDIYPLGFRNSAMAVGLVDNLIPNLRCLVLSYTSFKPLYLGDLLYRFYFLKDFTLYLNRQSSNHFDTIFEEGIQISNCSLERIKLAMKGYPCYNYNDKVRRPRVKFDVPSVREFTFEGAVIPILSFMSTPPSREWESHLSIECQQDGFSAVWFNELSELLTQLSQSKTHLSLSVGDNTSSFNYKVGDKIVQGLRKHELENLTIDMTDLPSYSCYALFDGLFRLCRPKLITQYYEDDQQEYNRQTNIDFLCQILEEGIKFKVSRPTQFMYGLNDLEEVNAQAFDVDEWKPIPFESLLDDDAPDEHEHEQAKQRIRLLLKWKPSY